MSYIPIWEQLVNEVNDFTGWLVNMGIRRPLGYATFHAEERMTAHEAARQDYFFRKSSANFGRRLAGQGYNSALSYS